MSIQSGDLCAMTCFIKLNADPQEGTIKELHPMTLSTQANAAYHPMWDQAMNGPDSQGYWEACKKQLHTLMTKRKSWKVVTRESQMKILPST